MRAHTRSDLYLVATASVVALGLPCAAAAHLASRMTEDLEPALTAVLGEQVSIGSMEAGLTGELCLSEVRIGRVFMAGSIEASVALPSLLSGDLDADEIRVEEPRLMVRVDADGSSNLGRLVERAARHRAFLGGGGAAADDLPGAPSPKRARRIVVSGGDLLVNVDGWGEVQLSGVALSPRAGGIRATSSDVVIHMQRGAWTLRGRIERAAADLGLPSLRAPRFLAVGGELELLTRGAPPLALTGLTIGRGLTGDALVIQGRVGDAASSAAPLTASLTRLPQGLMVKLEGHHVPLALLAPLLPRSMDLAEARGHGHVVVEAHAPDGRPDGRIDLELDATVDDLGIDDRRVAREAIKVSSRVEMRASLSRTGTSERRVDIERMALTLGKLRIELHGWAERAGSAWLPDRGMVSLEVPPLPCASALGSLPEGLRDHLSGLDMAGTFKAAARLDFSRARSHETELDLDIDVTSCRVLREAVAANPRMLEQPFEHTFPDGSRALVGKGQAGYTPLSALPRHLLAAFISAEDGRFDQHHGFDTEQIERSLAIDLRDGAFVRGGSTISQQLVKNIFLSHHRTLARKLQEAVLTWRLEAHLDKKLILERYLNIIELGPHVFGVSAAARHWFDKEPGELTVRESAFLAALTRAPQTMSRRIAGAGGIDAQTSERIATVLRAMRRDGAISDEAYRRAQDARLELRPDLMASR